MDFEKASHKVGEILHDLSNDMVAVFAERIKAIGSLGDEDDIQYLVAQARYTDLSKMEQMLADATDETVSAIDDLFKQAAEESSDWAQVYYAYRGIDSNISKPLIDSLVSNAAKSTTDEVVKLVQTSAFQGTTYQQAYNDVVNKAVAAVSTGSVDYRTATRDAVRDYAANGLTVEYPDGSMRRLDSAVRMNVKDGAKSVMQDLHNAHGKAFGADGYELDAHAMCAPDHVGVQGRQYTKAEWGAVYLKRPIGRLNCGHTLYPIIVGVSRSAYTEEELETMKANSNEQITYTGVSGKELSSSRYEATQYQRKLETGIRTRNDMSAAAEKMGDTTMARRYATDSKNLQAEYKRVSSEIGIKEQPWRYK